LNHGFLPMKKHTLKDERCRKNSSLRTVCLQHYNANFKLQYENDTNCLVVSSAVLSSKSSSHDMTKDGTILLRPFVTIWKWRTCTIGYTLIGESCIKHTSLDGNKGPLPSLMSDLAMIGNEKMAATYPLHNACLCYDVSAGYRFAFLSECGDEMLRKEILGVGLLSPSSTKEHGMLNDIREPSSIFLTHDTLSYLDVLSVSSYISILFML